MTGQWYDRNYWKELPQLTEKIDALIDEFNAEIRK